MQRLPHWAEALHNYLIANAKTLFSWGSFDCALFTAGAIEAVTGTDVATDFKGKYTDEAGAIATIKSVTSGSTVEDAAVYVAKKYELTELKFVLCAQRGDMVVFDGDEGVAVGIVHLNGTECLFVTAKGINKIPLKQIRRAWRVG